MRRITSMLLALCLLLLCACGDTATTPQEASAAPQETDSASAAPQETEASAKLLYMGHASLRITTPEGKVIYIDPYVGDGYDLPADLILVTHDHYDHNKLDKVTNRNPDCTVITWEQALEGGVHQSFDLGYATIEAVEAGYNAHHDVEACVGYVLTLSDSTSIYVSGDTSTTQQMPELAKKDIDYAFFCCDGVFNMDLDEAAACAKLVGAHHNIPYHVVSQDGVYFDEERAAQFDAPNRLIIHEGEEITLTPDSQAQTG